MSGVGEGWAHLSIAAVLYEDGYLFTTVRSTGGNFAATRVSNQLGSDARALPTQLAPFPPLDTA